MMRIERSTRLPHPPAEVFGVVTDFEAYPAWQEDVVQSELDGDRPAVGATVRQVRRFMNTRAEAVMAIAELEPDRLLSLRTVAGSRLRVDQSYRVAAADGGSRIDVVIELDGLSSMAERVVGNTLDAYVRRQMERLDVLLAGRAPARPTPA
jgi:ribosome-associated toxin RatA of RatAB toxin-antitoxin module